MSGHSHYATIKRQKESKDAQKGNLFSKLTKEIALAAKSGGGPDPDTNYKLRVAIDRAKASNMPKDNIERVLEKVKGATQNLDEVTYEGFGPGGINVIIEAVTDNRNRTSQEIKNLFERGGGNMAGPGSVAFNFEPKGLLVIKKEGNSEEIMLKLIDAGVEDLEETEDGIEVYVSYTKLSETKSKLEGLGFVVSSFELTKKPKSLQDVEDKQQIQKTLSFLESLESHEDVQKVYTNFNVPDSLF